MADIHLERRHTMGLKKAKAAAQKVAYDLAADYGITSTWDGDVLRFERKGVSGELVVAADRICLDARLGLLLSPMRPRIEAQVDENFSQYFA